MKVSDVLQAGNEVVGGFRKLTIGQLVLAGWESRISREQQASHSWSRKQKLVLPMLSPDLSSFRNAIIPLPMHP